MGSLQAQEMAELADLDTALTWHLRANHYPPVPLSMLQACKDAIEFCNDGNPYELIQLPDGVTYKGEDSAPAWAIVEQHHLSAWIDYNEDEEYN